MHGDHVEVRQSTGRARVGTWGPHKGRKGHGRGSKGTSIYTV